MKDPRAQKTVPLWFTEPGPFAPDQCTFVNLGRTTTVNFMALEFDVPRADGNGPARLIIPISIGDLNRLHQTLNEAVALANPPAPEDGEPPKRAN